MPPPMTTTEAWEGRSVTGSGPPGYFWQTGQKKVDRPDWTLRRTVALFRPHGQGLPSRP